MKKLFLASGLLVVFFLVFNVGSAIALSIDFSDVSNYEVIDSKYAPALVLSSIENFNGILNSLPIDTGTDVRGSVNSDDYIGVSADSFQGILLTFEDLMSSVSVVGFDWGGDSIQDNETMYLSAFNEGGTFLGGDTFGGTFANPNTRLGTLAFDSMKYVAFTFGNTTLGFYGIDSIEAVEATAPVPEPGTIVLMGLGLVGLAGMGRKKLFKK